MSVEQAILEATGSIAQEEMQQRMCCELCMCRVHRNASMHKLQCGLSREPTALKIKIAARELGSCCFLGQYISKHVIVRVDEWASERVDR